MDSKGSVSLSSGREIQVVELHQFFTYEGVLEGLPTVEMNRAHVEHVLKEYRDWHQLGEPYLIPPVETPITWERRYPFGTPARIPAVTCVGRFRSGAFDRSPAKYSSLVVIWFQESFAPPVDAATMEQLLRLDWEGNAKEFEW